MKKVQNSEKGKRQICTIHDKLKVSHAVFHTSCRLIIMAEMDHVRQTQQKPLLSTNNFNATFGR